MGLHRVKGKGWRYQFQYQGQSYSKAWFQTKAEAIAAREAHKKQIKNPIQTQTGTDFLTEINNYLDFCKRKFHRRTYQFKSYVYGIFMECVGNLPMDAIDINVVEKYLKTRPTNSSFNTHLKTLRAFFSWAFKRRKIMVNPCILIEDLPTEKFQRQIYSQDDIVKLFLAAGEHRPFLLALFSLAGRVGETSRLRWDDVNFERREVILWTSKGGKLRPQVKAMNEELYNLLQGLYNKNSGAWVFPNPRTGKPYVCRDKQIAKICKAAGVENLWWHAIRHHVASLLSDIHKKSLPTISKMLGHANLTTTQIYISSLTDDVRDSAELLSPKNLQDVTESDKSGNEVAHRKNSLQASD